MSALIGAFACTIAATVGTMSLTLAGVIDPEILLDNWSTWWLGDLAGMMLITPVFLFLRTRSVWEASTKTLIGMALSLVLLGLVSQFIFGGQLSEGIAEGFLYMPLIVVFFLLLWFAMVLSGLFN